jgi:hypothetical protein
VSLTGLLRAEGSTRAVGLLRLALGLCQWSEWGIVLAPFKWDSLADAPVAAAVFVGSTLLVIGLASRPAALLLGGLECGLVLFGPREPWGHHHTWLLAITTFILAFTPCDRSLSLDRWLRLVRGSAPPERGPLWATSLIRLQLSVLYGVAAIDKLTPGFLAGERLEMIFADKYFGSEPVPIPGVVLVAASWAAVAAELFLALAVWVPRLRLPGLLTACGLHAAFYLLLPVGTFSVTTLALWLVVFPAAEVHRVVDRMFEDADESTRW